MRAPGPGWRSWSAAAVQAVVQGLVVVLAGWASLVLRSGVPLVPNTSSYDGLLFARLGRNLVVGDWLGDFDLLTLAKGPGYPFFIALAHGFRVDLKVAEQLVHLCAVAAVALAVLVCTRRPWMATAGFVFLALDPANFGVNSADVMRDNLFASFGVLVLALGFLTAVGVVRRSRWVGIVLGAVSTGIVSAAYWLTREEGVTILPPLAVMVLAVLLMAWRGRRRDGEPRSRSWIARPAVATVLVAVFAVAPLYAVGAVNEDRYGVSLLNDQGEGTFLRAYADWSRVDAGPRPARVPIDADQRDAVYEVSPAARQLRRSLEDPENQWRGFGCVVQDAAVCDYSGGWMIWALREAAEERGHFDTAEDAQAFFGRLSADIEAACADGRLTCAARLPASLQPLQRAPLGPLAANIAGFAWDTLTARDLYRTPTVTPELPELFRAEYALVVSDLPDSSAAAEQEMTEFRERQGPYDALGSLYGALVPASVLLGLVGCGTAVVRAVRGGRPTGFLLALALGLAAGFAVRSFLLAVIQTADFDVVARYLLPGYAMATAFAVVGIAAGVASISAGRSTAPGRGGRRRPEPREPRREPEQEPAEPLPSG